MTASSILSLSLLTQFFFSIYLFIFLAVRGLSLVVATLCCGARASHCSGLSCCGARAPGAQASAAAACGLSSCGLRAPEHRPSSCGAWAQVLRGMWDLPGPGLEPVSPALADGFLTTAPPGKPPNSIFIQSVFKM